MDILNPFLKILDNLEDLVENSTRVPFVDKALIDIEHFFDLTNSLRTSLPREIKDIENMIKKAQQIKEDAELEAKNTITKAHEYVTNLVKEDEITKQAKLEAEKISKSAKDEVDRIIKEAENHAVVVKNGANDYTRGLLEDVLAKLKTCGIEVQNGLDELTKQRND